MGLSRRPFVGRQREIEEIASGCDDAAAGRGALFLLVGPPGIGKTRLGDETTRVAQERGFRVLWGRCWETGGAPAFWPWIQVLRELGDEAILAAHGAHAASDRFTLFDTVVGFLRTRRGGRSAAAGVRRSARRRSLVAGAAALRGPVTARAAHLWCWVPTGPRRHG